MSNDDFETFDSPEEMPQQTVSAAEIFRNNPSLKIFSIVAVVGIVVSLFLIFGSGGDDKPVSRVSGKSDVVEAPGTSRLTPEYETAIKEKDKQSLDNALKTGKSVFPTPINKQEERIDAPSVNASEDDPLEIWRKNVEKKSVLSSQRRNRDAESLLTKVEKVPEINVEPPKPVMVKKQMPTTPTHEEVGNRAKLLQKQMGMILESKVPQPGILLSLTDVASVVGTNQPLADSEVAGLSSLEPMNDIREAPPEPIIMPGDIAYAQMMVEANSDIAGPIMAYIASGPLSGAKALGSFSNDEKYLTMTFNTAVLGKKQYAINAYALDTETTLTGMATDVNNHYFSRVVLPAAAEFLKGFAKAVTESGNTTVTVNGETVVEEKEALDPEDELLEGVSEGIDELSTIIDDEGPDEPTVRVESGTRFGLLFMQPVYEIPDNKPSRM